MTGQQLDLFELPRSLDGETTGRQVPAGDKPVVVCRSMRRAAAVASALASADGEGSLSLPLVTTIEGAAVRRLAAAGDTRALLPGGQRRGLIRELLATDRHHWVVLAPYASRAAFPPELAAALDEWNHALRPPPPDPRWREVAAFAHEYDERCAARSVVDRATAIRLAAVDEAPSPFTHVLVDESLGELTAAEQLLLRRLGNGSDPGRLQLATEPRSEPERRLVTSRHPSLEGEVVVGELLAAADRGVPWHDMAVLVRRPSQRAPRIARSLRRHGIPCGYEPPLDVSDPAVSYLVEQLRREGGTSRPADVAHEVFRRSFRHLVAEPERDPGTRDPIADRALDAVTSFLRGLQEWNDGHPTATVDDFLAGLDDPDDDELELWQGGRGDSGGVTVTSVSAAADQEWRVAVIAGAVEGELPRIRRTPRFLTLAGEQRADPVEEEQRMWEVATTRATDTVVAVASPEPGVLLSRFVEGWQTAEAQQPPVPATAFTRRQPTTSTTPVWPDQRLRLSATKLATWQDCPLKFAYAYGLGLRGPSNVWADFGTLVHDILAAFLDPAKVEPRTRERLMELAEERWSDDIAPYRPQREQARKELGEVLEVWWEREGKQGVEALFVEKRFEVQAGDHTITGSIDRVARSDDGNGIEILDYKTSRSTKLTKAAAEDDIQLATYHLAASRDPEIAAHGPVKSLRLLYVRDMTDRQQSITADHAERTERAVLAMAGEMLAEGFDPALDADCGHCDYHRLCPLQDKGREVPAP